MRNLDRSLGDGGMPLLGQLGTVPGGAYVAIVSKGMATFAVRRATR
jgi:hypothetical protein